MSKISISKKTAWSLILKINNKISYKDNLVDINEDIRGHKINICLLYTSPSPRDA